MKTYLIWLLCDDIEPMLVGVADTMEQAEKMKARLIEDFEDIYEYNIQEFKRNTVTINDVDYTF